MKNPGAGHPPQTQAAPEILCVGETMAVITSADASALAEANRVTLSAGGAESNVAQYLAEQGFKTAWISALGQDALGERILSQLRGNGVDCRWVETTEEANTGLYVKDPRPRGTRVHYYRAGSAASRMGPERIGNWPVSTARWVHITGITPALSASCQALIPALIEAAHAAGAGVSMDINYRPALWPEKRAAQVLAPLANTCDVVLVGLDEAQRLWPTTRDAQQAAALFPHASRVIIKDGAGDATSFHRTREGQVVTSRPAPAVDVVEAVGAGDAFAAGYLTGLLRGASEARSLESGHALAGWVLGCAEDYRPGHGPTVTQNH